MGYSNWAELLATTQDNYIKAPTSITLSANPDPLEVDLQPTIVVTGFATFNGSPDNHIATRYMIVDVVDGTVMWTYESTTELLSTTMTGASLAPSTDYKCIVAFKGATYGWGDNKEVLFLSENVELLAPTVTVNFPSVTISTPVVDNGTITGTTTIDMKVTDATGTLVADITNIPYSSPVDLGSLYPFVPESTYTVCTRLVNTVFGASDYTCNTFTTPKIVIDVSSYPTITVPPPVGVVAPDAHVGTWVRVSDGAGTELCTHHITTGNLTSVDLSACNLPDDTDVVVCVTYEFSQTADRGAYCNTIHTPTAVVPTISTPTFTITGETGNVPVRPTITVSAPVVTGATYMYLEYEYTGATNSGIITLADPILSEVIRADLVNNSSYAFRVRYVATGGLVSPWATKNVTTNFGTPTITVSDPVFTITGEPSNVTANPTISVDTPTITGDTFSYCEYEYTGASTGSGMTFTIPITFVPAVSFNNNSSYTFRVRHHTTTGVVSNWATKNVTTNYVATVNHPSSSDPVTPVYLPANYTYSAEPNNSIYGSTGTETVTIPITASGIIVDQNVDQINFPLSSTEYDFSVLGNTGNISYDGRSVLSGSFDETYGDTARFQFSDVLIYWSSITPLRFSYNFASSSTFSVPSYTRCYGNTDNNIVAIRGGITNIETDQNIEQVTFTNNIADYRFTQSGNVLQVLLNSVLIGAFATLSTALHLVFNGNDKLVQFNLGVITVGGVTITTDTQILS